MLISIPVSVLPKFQEVFRANDSSSDSTSIDEFVATATYQDLIQNPHLFQDKLWEFLQHSDKTLKIPVVGGISLDLHKLFIEVTSRGGIEQVIKDRKCKEVIGTFNFQIRITNEAYVLRKYYLKLLFEFEHVYYFQEPISSFWVREESLKRLVKKSTNHINGTQELQSDRQVYYQEKGFEDQERYKAEMLEHISSVHSCAAKTPSASVAMSDAAAALLLSSLLLSLLLSSLPDATAAQ